MKTKQMIAAALSAFMVLSCTACDSGSRRNTDAGSEPQNTEVSSSDQQNDVSDTQKPEIEENSEVNGNSGNDNTSNQSGLIRMGRITSDLSVFDGFGDTVEMRIEIRDE